MKNRSLNPGLFIVFIVGLAVFSFPPRANSAPEIWDKINNSGYTGPNFVVTDDNSNSLLNPRQEVIEFSDYEGEYFSNLYSDVFINRSLSFSSKIRISGIKRNHPTYLIRQNDRLIEDEEEEAQLDFDEAYFEFNLGNTLFGTVGKINLIKGEGLSYNPSYFFGEVNSASDPTWSEEEKRVNQEGEYTMRLEKFWQGYTLTASLVPELGDSQDTTEFEFKANTTAGNSSLGASIFYSEASTNLGFNISSTVTDKLELHSELGLYSDNPKKHLRRKTRLSTDVYEYELYNPEDSKEVYPEFLAGGHYTWENGTNLIVEYFYNSKGYDQQEWDKYVDTARENKNYLLNPPPGFSGRTDLFRKNLSLANEVANFRRMRRHYVYIRLRNRKLYESLDISGGLLTSIADGSSVALPSLTYKWNNQMELKAGGNILAGDPDSEFGISPKKGSYYVEMRYFF